MRRFRAHIALLLLVLLARVLAPEAAVLAMHQHEHTEDKPAGDFKVSAKHQHCHVGDLYNTNFSFPEFLFTLIAAPAGSHYIQPYSFVWKFTFPNNIHLRGPPTV